MKSCALLLIVFTAAAAASPGGARAGIVDDVDVTPEARMRATLMPREYGWNDDKHAPALRIKDEDREKPARERPEWIKWRQTLGAHRTYHNTTHEELSARIFEQTEVLVEMHQKAFEKGQVTYTTAINAMADLTEEEFGRMLNNDALKEGFSNGNVTSIDEPHELLTLPLQFDWRTNIQFTSVKNQGECGSCYAFSTIATIEAHLKWKKGIFAELSQQFLIDCTRNYTNTGMNNGCKGGWPTVSYNWLKTSQRPIPYSTSSPYLYGNGDLHKACPKQSDGVVKIKSYGEVSNPAENVFAELLYTKGPLDTALHAENVRPFRDYSGGIWSMVNCPTEPNHAVVAVGYGIQNGRNFWTIRNSWGPSWGIGGYMKLARGQKMCGFPAIAVWPILV